MAAPPQTQESRPQAASPRSAPAIGSAGQGPAALRRRLRAGVFTAVGLYAALVVAYAALQGRFVFPAPRVVDRTPADVGVSFEEASIDTEDGETLHGYWMPAGEDSRGTWLYFHGNGSSVAGTVDFAKLLRDRGWSVLVVDYRGYGKSTGSPSEAGLAQDARASWRYLTDTKGIAPASIVIHGRSLGGGVAVTLAAEVEAAALVVESSFTSIADVARLTYWWLPIDLLLRHRFDSESRMSAIAEPVLVLHSHGDARIPFSHAERLVAATPRDEAHAGAVLHELQGDHNETIKATGPDRYARMLDEFGARHMPSKVADPETTRGETTRVVAAAKPVVPDSDQAPPIDRSCKADADCVPAPGCCPTPCSAAVINVAAIDEAQRRLACAEPRWCPSAGPCRTHVYLCVDGNCTIAFEGDPEYRPRQ